MSAPENQVSWLLIRPGWTVDASDRADAGRVEGVAGDPNADIFDGLIVSPSGGPAVYLEAARVAWIREGRVGVDLDAGALERLPAHEVSDSLRILPEGASMTERVSGWLRGDS